MQARVYQYKGKQKQIKKNLGSGETINIIYTEGTTLLNPSLRYTVNDDTDFTFLKWNYVVLNFGSTKTDWGNRERYYFVDTGNVKNIAKGVWIVPLKLDVLSTYSKEILASTANIERSSSNYNLYLNDTFYNAFAYPRVGCKIFPSGFSDNYNYLLTVCNTLNLN